jgi:guanyl-specific ribonuclease Sa
VKRLLILLFLAVAGLASGTPPLAARSQPVAAAPIQVPPEARTVLAQVRAAGRPFPGYVGGRRFGNYGGGGEQKLPVRDARGRKINYQEWDIHPRTEGHGRGPERLVTGDDGRGWFTADHYRSFTEVR